MAEAQRNPAKSAQSPATSRGEARRQALIDTASEMFLEYGYEGVSLEELVSRVGGSKASVYQYFGGKESLFYEIIAAGCEHFFRELKIPESADEDVVATLREVGRQYLSMELVPRQREWFRLLISVLPRFPELAKRFYEQSAVGIRGRFANYLRLQCEAGRLQSNNPELLAAHFFELLSGRSHIRILLGLEPFPPEDPVEAHVDAVVSHFLYGCSA